MQYGHYKFNAYKFHTKNVFNCCSVIFNLLHKPYARKGLQPFCKYYLLIDYGRKPHGCMYHFHILPSSHISTIIFHVSRADHCSGHEKGAIHSVFKWNGSYLHTTSLIRNVHALKQINACVYVILNDHPHTDVNQHLNK